jgi:hypothetical protein
MGSKDVERDLPTTTMWTEYYKVQTNLNLDLFFYQQQKRLDSLKK